MRAKDVPSTPSGRPAAAAAARRLLPLPLAGLLLAGAAIAAAALPAVAQDLGPLRRITGASPFAGCTADDAAGQPGVNYPDTEIEPWVDANPRNPRNLIAGWQQDRWSNGGARGNAAGVSFDGGATWRTVLVPGTSACAGGSYQRASDPWVSVAPNGTAYFMSLALDPDPPSGAFGRNAMLVNRSTDGGRSWGRPTVLRADPTGQALNDKNAITADPTDARFAYAVWDRLVDFGLPPDLRGGGNRGARLRSLLLQGQAADAQPAQVFFEGPALLARTADGGRSWERARVIHDPGGNAQTIGNQVVVRPDGTVMNFFNEIFTNGTFNVSLIRSFDKGRTFGRASRVASAASSLTGTITPDAQEPVRDAAVLFDVAVDPRSGALHAVWQDTRFRGVDEVAFSQSFDGGYSWTRPLRINKTPANRNRFRQQAFVPSVEVGAGGAVVVTYYDFRNDASPGELTDHWAIVCRARCGTAAGWGGERRLTPRSFDMLRAPVARGRFLGDYVGLVAAGRAVYPVFGIADAVNGASLFVRRIDLGAPADAAVAAAAP
jgi:hypothetical protein